jgi:GAF domain-containing protein
MALQNAVKKPQGAKITDVVTGQEMRAGLSVPCSWRGPIGTLDLYSPAPRDWHQVEISALQAYAALAATVLSQARSSRRPPSPSRPS